MLSVFLLIEDVADLLHLNSDIRSSFWARSIVRRKNIICNYSRLCLSSIYKYRGPLYRWNDIFSYSRTYPWYHSSRVLSALPLFQSAWQFPLPPSCIPSSPHPLACLPSSVSCWATSDWFRRISWPSSQPICTADFCAECYPAWWICNDFREFYF